MKKFFFIIAIVSACILAPLGAYGEAPVLAFTGAQNAVFSPTPCAMDTEMLDYINTARAQAGLAPLVPDAQLCYGATLKNDDMIENNYFSHISPAYGSPVQLMNRLGITHHFMGENLSMNFSVKQAFDAFIQSPPHRDNILNPQFTKIGLNCCQSGSFLYTTLWFTD